MNFAGKEGLMPTRVSSQITPAAKNIWQKFLTNKDVVSVPLEDTTAHKEEFLNRKYLLKKKFNTINLEKNNEIILRNDKFGEKRTLIVEGADKLLRNKMVEIYETIKPKSRSSSNIYFVMRHEKGKDKVIGIFDSPEEAWTKVENFKEKKSILKNLWGDVISSQHSVSVRPVEVPIGVNANDVAEYLLKKVN